MFSSWWTRLPIPCGGDSQLPGSSFCPTEELLVEVVALLEVTGQFPSPHLGKPEHVGSIDNHRVLAWDAEGNPHVQVSVFFLGLSYLYIVSQDNTVLVKIVIWSVWFPLHLSSSCELGFL